MTSGLSCTFQEKNTNQYYEKVVGTYPYLVSQANIITSLYEKKIVEAYPYLISQAHIITSLYKKKEYDKAFVELINYKEDVINRYTSEDFEKNLDYFSWALKTIKPYEELIELQLRPYNKHHIQRTSILLLNEKAEKLDLPRKLSQKFNDYIKEINDVLEIISKKEYGDADHHNVGIIAKNINQLIRDHEDNKSMGSLLKEYLIYLYESTKNGEAAIFETKRYILSYNDTARLTSYLHFHYYLTLDEVYNMIENRVIYNESPELLDYYKNQGTKFLLKNYVLYDESFKFAPATNKVLEDEISRHFIKDKVWVIPELEKRANKLKSSLQRFYNPNPGEFLKYEHGYKAIFFAKQLCDSYYHSKFGKRYIGIDPLYFNRIILSLQKAKSSLILNSEKEIQKFEHERKKTIDYVQKTQKQFVENRYNEMLLLSELLQKKLYYTKYVHRCIANLMAIDRYNKDYKFNLTIDYRKIGESAYSAAMLLEKKSTDRKSTIELHKIAYAWYKKYIPDSVRVNELEEKLEKYGINEVKINY